jgi:ABC-type antimicrobial peptide transport system permease subunit
VRQQIRAASPNLAIDNVNVVGDLLSLRESQRRFDALVLSGLASIALLLAAVGIYGTISYWVKQRTPEIGLRMALGADGHNVSWLVLKNGTQFIVAGLSLGVVGALAATKLIASSLFGVAASDPATFAAIATLLFMVALSACWIPARRAARVDPMVALRHE